MRSRIMRNRKGFFFTVIAIYLVAALMLSALFYNKYQMRRQAAVDSSRILAMNDFIKDVDSDLERGLYISGFRTLLGLEEYISQTGNYLNNTEDAFQEAFFNRSIGNYTIGLLNDSSFSDWEQKIQSQAESLNIGTNFTVNSIEITQESPWNVELYINLTMLVYDTTGMASWARQKTIHSSISITGFEDSLYTVNSYGRVAQTIEQDENTAFVSGNNTAVLLNHLDNSLYTASATAPSFLMRLAGNLSSSPYGIESLVNVSKLAVQGIPARSASIVDYIYFGTRATSNLCIDNSKAEPDLPSWFMLDTDDSHALKYQITEISRVC